MHQLPKPLLFFLIAFSSLSGAWAQDSSRLSTEQSMQAGFEYDTNALKSYGGSKGDSLVRVLLKSRGTYRTDSSIDVGWSAQAGGKKFFSYDEQDVLITYAEFPFVWYPTRRFTLTFIPDAKYQNERDAVDTLSKDVNEDFFSTTSRLMGRIVLPNTIHLEPTASYTFFRFAPQQSFSFHREQGGMGLRKGLFGVTAIGAQYGYSRQQFLAGSREDRTHEFSGYFQYLSIPYFSARYTYQDAGSTDPRFAFTNHRVSLLLSIPMGQRENAEQAEPTEESPGSLFALHILGTLQLKSFPPIYDETAEGNRFIVTGAEDDNFNSVVVKFSYHPTSRFAVETKFTRYSNELSSQSQSFSRSLLYGGVRVLF